MATLNFDLEVGGDAYFTYPPVELQKKHLTTLSANKFAELVNTPSAYLGQYLQVIKLIT